MVIDACGELVVAIAPPVREPGILGPYFVVKDVGLGRVEDIVFLVLAVVAQVFLVRLVAAELGIVVDLHLPFLAHRFCVGNIGGDAVVLGGIVGELPQGVEHQGTRLIVAADRVEVRIAQAVAQVVVEVDGERPAAFGKGPAVGEFIPQVVSFGSGVAVVDGGADELAIGCIIHPCQPVFEFI